MPPRERIWDEAVWVTRRGWRAACRGEERRMGWALRCRARGQSRGEVDLDERRSSACTEWPAWPSGRMGSGL